MSVTIDLKPDSRKESPFSTDEQRYYTLRENTYKICTAQKMDEGVADGLMRFLSYRYNFLMHDNQVAQAHELLSDYEDMLNKFKYISDKKFLKKVDDTLAKWISSIDAVYKKTENFEQYLEGMQKMFNAVFGYMDKPLVQTMYIEKMKAELAQNFEENNPVAA